MADLDVVVMSGSLRAGSVNTLVADTLVARAETALDSGSLQIRRLDLRPVPFFDQDLEDAGDPAAVVELKTAVVGADAVVLVTPEYNAGVPAVMKNAVDWLSRPYGNGSLIGKPAGVISAGPGGRGGLGARTHLTDSLGILTDRLFEEALGLASIYGRIDDGQLAAEASDELLAWFGRFVAFARG